MLRDVIERADTSHQDSRGLPEHDTRTRGRARPDRTDRALPDDSVHRTRFGAGTHCRNQPVRLSDPAAFLSGGEGKAYTFTTDTKARFGVSTRSTGRQWSRSKSLG